MEQIRGSLGAGERRRGVERTRGALCRLSWPPLPKHAQVPHPPSHRPQPHLVHRPGVLVSPDTRGNNLSSLSQLDLRLSGRVGGRAVGYYLVTTLLAVSLGILLCTTIQPGSEGGEAGREAGHQGGAASGGAADTLLDLLTNCFPPNLVQATMQQYKTVLEDPGQETVEDKETGAMLVPSQPHTWRLAGSWTHSTNILGLVVSYGLSSVVSTTLCCTGVLPGHGGLHRPVRPGGQAAPRLLPVALRRHDAGTAPYCVPSLHCVASR